MVDLTVLMEKMSQCVSMKVFNLLVYLGVKMVVVSIHRKICDRVANCPNRDDERCIFKCPPSCICKGLVLSCTTLQSVSSMSIRPLHLYLQLYQSHRSKFLI